MTFLSGFSEIIKDDAYLARGEKLAVGVVACGCKLLSELGIAVDPTHQVACGGARGAVGEVKERKLLFAVTMDFHFYQKLKLKSLFSFAIIIFSKITPSLFTIKEGSTSHPDPLALRGEGETAPPRRSEPLRSKEDGPSKVSSEFFVGWRFEMQGVTLRDSRHNAGSYDFFYGTYDV